MSGSCEDCVQYIYDDEAECRVCFADLDEDEMFRFFSGTSECPSYRRDDGEYSVVKKQK